MSGHPQPSPTAEMVGTSFVRQYYTLLNNNPWQLHRFYKESSCLTHGAECEAALTPIRGQKVHFQNIFSTIFGRFCVMHAVARLRTCCPWNAKRLSVASVNAEY